MQSLGVITAALIAGFLGSLHCVGMCGAIACSKMLLLRTSVHSDSSINVVPKSLPILVNSMVFNLARILTYVLLGACLAFVGQKLILSTGLESLAKAVRLLGAVLIALIGLRFLINLRWVDAVEKIGLGLWSRLKFYKLRPSDSKDAYVSPGNSTQRVFFFGLLWGLLPCALVYTMLLTAISSGSASQGALIMLAFGLGTLPAMLGMSFFADSMRLFAQRPWLRQFFGFALIVIAVYVFVFNLQMNTQLGHHHH